ncbi:MAG: hypothetical protein RQ754_06655 [Desulfuromonadales bacterium]|nr:hypothetical protein [Desulfuromonadales bacterium]
MGLFGKMFGSESQYPDLSGESDAAGKLAAIRGKLEKLAAEVHDKMEVVPTDDGAYVFIGKPPKKFGIAWIEGGEVKSFKTMMEEHGMTNDQAIKFSNELREVYERHLGDKRFHARIADKDIVVTPSQPLENDVREVLSHLH